MQWPRQIHAFYEMGKIVKDPNLSLNDGAITPYAVNTKGYYYAQVLSVAKAFDASADTPWKKLPLK